MKRTYEDRQIGEAKHQKQKGRSKRYVKDGGHRKNHINGNGEIDIDALEEMFEDR